mmetsp:Transcript_32375/g.49527  ORF Transcript_32375/g.49527 Transcript_32375/m.49527 type:complete len:263 (-) Transcript_32375:163-951(-)
MGKDQGPCFHLSGNVERLSYRRMALQNRFLFHSILKGSFVNQNIRKPTRLRESSGGTTIAAVAKPTKRLAIYRNRKGVLTVRNGYRNTLGNFQLGKNSASFWMIAECRPFDSATLKRNIGPLHSRIQPSVLIEKMKHVSGAHQQEGLLLLSHQGVPFREKTDNAKMMIRVWMRNPHKPNISQDLLHCSHIPTRGLLGSQQLTNRPLSCIQEHRFLVVRAYVDSGHVSLFAWQRRPRARKENFCVVGFLGSIVVSVGVGGGGG